VPYTAIELRLQDTGTPTAPNDAGHMAVDMENGQ
jgi:hypothetical protein